MFYFTYNTVLVTLELYNTLYTNKNILKRKKNNKNGEKERDRERKEKIKMSEELDY